MNIWSSKPGKRLGEEDLSAETPEEFAELEAEKAQEAVDNAAMEAECAKRKEVVDKEFAFFRRIYPETDGKQPLPPVNMKNRTEIS